MDLDNAVILGLLGAIDIFKFISQKGCHLDDDYTSYYYSTNEKEIMNTF